MIPTPGQTIGPFFGFALPFEGGPELVPVGWPGAVQLTGVVLDGAGAPVPDAVVEIWQPDPTGAVVAGTGSLQRDGFTFTGWGRAPTDATGRYRFTTLRPGGEVPFIAVTLFARGLLHRLFTRIYLPGHRPDRLLTALPDDRRRTLMATDTGSRIDFDIRLQGEGETVFLRFPGHDD